LHRLGVFKNRVLRRISGPLRDEVTRSRTKLHDEELHYMYCSPNTVTIFISRRIRRAVYVACMEAFGHAY
jgi:hypothetical protein